MDFDLVADVADRFLANAGNVTRVHGEQLAMHLFFGHPWADRIGDACERPAHGVGNHRDRFGEPDVPDRSQRNLMLELLPGKAGTNLLLKWKPPLTRVLHA